MRPQDKKIGSKVTIICPNCDGIGQDTMTQENGLVVIINCPECKGFGTIEAEKSIK